MVNKREKKSTLYIISISNKQLSSFFLLFYFISFLLPFSSFFPHPLRFNFVEAERNVHSFLPTYLGGTFFSLLDVSERNFFLGWGGGVHVHPEHHPPCVRACNNSHYEDYTNVYNWPTTNIDLWYLG